MESTMTSQVIKHDKERSFKSAIERELAEGCQRKVAKRLALRVAKAVASGCDEDIALAKMLVRRLQWRIDLMYSAVERSADRRYQECSF